MYPVSTGIYPGVFWADSIGGLAPRHKTLATRKAIINFSKNIYIRFSNTLL
jgi:hypothetical protein